MSRKKLNPEAKKMLRAENALKRLPDLQAKNAEIRRKRLERQRRFLKAYEELDTKNITEACRVAGVSRSAVHKWSRVDRKFQEQLMIIEESFLDKVESMFYQRAIGKTTAGCKDSIMAIMRTKGKDRGYGEKHMIEADITHRISQDRIDALVKAHERITNDREKIPDRVIQEIESARNRIITVIPEKLPVEQESM